MVFYKFSNKTLILTTLSTLLKGVRKLQVTQVGSRSRELRNFKLIRNRYFVYEVVKVVNLDNVSSVVNVSKVVKVLQCCQ